MDEKILKILRGHRDSFISAHEIGRGLSLSTTSVAKNIDKLRAEGYRILSQPHLGYRLTGVPDKMLPAEIGWQLNTQTIGCRILAYDTVDSTNSVAFSLAQKAMPSGTAVFAEGQSKGRGRLGRSWVSPKAKGIYLSLILRPKIAAEKAALITLLAAVSCAEAIRKVSGLTAQIRWPNDILLGHRKTAGILTEMDMSGGKMNFIIVGIGINVTTPLNKLPAQASSLKEQNKNRKLDFSRLDLARELLRQLDKDYHFFQDKGAAGIITQWRNLSALSGKRVKVSLEHKGIIEGQAQDIDEQGALIVRLDNGFSQHVVAGDVSYIR